MKIFKYSAVILWASLLISGCSLQTTVPPSSKYMLSVDVNTTAVASSSFSDKVVRVGQMESSAILSGRSIYYTTDQGRSYSYTKARWLESAPQQLSALMMLSLTKSKVFKDVIPFRSLAKNDLIFESSLNQLLQTIHDDGTSTLHLSMKIRLVEQYSRKILASKLIEITREGVDGNAKGAVAGYSKMSKAVLLEIEKWLGESCKE